MNIDNLTIREARQLAELFNKGGGATKPSPYAVGEKYLIRMVTYHQVGVVREVFDDEIVLDSASWVAESGRFAPAIAGKAELKQTEFLGDGVIVGRGAIVDATPFRGELPKG